MMFFVCSSRRITSITDVLRTASVGSDSAWIASGVYLPNKEGERRSGLGVNQGVHRMELIGGKG